MARSDKPDLKVATILLAAGLSSRMGARNKLLIDIGGEPLVRRMAATYLAAKTNLTVVIGHEAAQVREALAGLPLTFVENPHFAEGQPTSIGAGLDSLKGDYDAVLIALADQAALGPGDIRDLLDAFAASDRNHILIPTFRGQRGNPVLFPFKLIVQTNADGHNNARRFTDANPQLVERYQAANDHFTTDIDTPDDLIAFTSRGTS